MSQRDHAYADKNMRIRVRMMDGESNFEVFGHSCFRYVTKLETTNNEVIRWKLTTCCSLFFKLLMRIAKGVEVSSKRDDNRESKKSKKG
jgi:hypothetical protein